MPFQMRTLGFFCGLKADCKGSLFYNMKQIIALITLMFLFASPANAFEKASGSSAKFQVEGISKRDTRVKVLEGYLKQYKSPLISEAENFVKYADLYNLDWRLVASISGVESTFGHQIPYQTYNGWGWGIYGTNMIYFTSWEEGIKTVSEGLRTNYLNKWGASNVYEIGKFYAASPTWARRVDYFMRNISDFALRNPQSALLLSI